MGKLLVEILCVLSLVALINCDSKVSKMSKYVVLSDYNTTKKSGFYKYLLCWYNSTRIRSVIHTSAVYKSLLNIVTLK